MEALPTTQPYDPGQHEEDKFWDDTDVDGVPPFEGQQRCCVRPCGVRRLIEVGTSQHRCRSCGGHFHAMCAATVNGSEDVNDCGCNKNLVIDQQTREAAHDALVDGTDPRTTPVICAPVDDSAPQRRDECPPRTDQYPQTETNDIANEWYGPSCPDAPDLSRATTLEICRGECQEWAKACGFNLVQKSADLKQGKATFVCRRKGRKASGKAGDDSLNPSQRRAKGNQYALPGEDMCPFRLNVRRQVDGLWKLATTNMKHNHRPLSELVQSYQNRVANLTVDMQEFITSLANAGIAPEDVLTCFRKKFPNAPLITVKDVVNIRTPTGGGSMDASLLLQELLRLQQEDSRWFVRFKVDPVTNRLTHLFWMSPRQRDMAYDLYQVIIHDNTYKTNRFKLPCGLFSAPNRRPQQTMSGSYSVTLKQLEFLRSYS
eukprot:jgi/Tetstr1/437385/TSEL_026069.t1